MILARSMKGRAGARIAATQSTHRRPLAGRRELVDRLCDDRGCVYRDEHVVIRQHVPLEVQVDADLEHCERRTLRGIDQRSPERIPPAAKEAGAFT